MKVYAQLPKTQKDTGRIHNKRRRKLYIFAEYAKIQNILGGQELRWALLAKPLEIKNLMQVYL